MSKDLNYARVMLEAERSLIKQALEKSNGNLTKAAEILGVPRTTFQMKLRKYRLDNCEQIFKLEQQNEQVVEQIAQKEREVKELHALSIFLEEEIERLKNANGGANGEQIKCANG